MTCNLLNGNKRKANSHLPSVDVESRRSGLAFQQATPTPGKLEGKESIRFIFHFPDKSCEQDEGNNGTPFYKEIIDIIYI